MINRFPFGRHPETIVASSKLFFIRICKEKKSEHNLHFLQRFVYKIHRPSSYIKVSQLNFTLNHFCFLTVWLTGRHLNTKVPGVVCSVNYYIHGSSLKRGANNTGSFGKWEDRHSLPPKWNTNVLIEYLLKLYSSSCDKMYAYSFFNLWRLIFIREHNIYFKKYVIWTILTLPP